MTEEDIADLRSLGEALAGAERSPWQPAAVSRAFARRAAAFVFTVQAWIDLDAARSPFLLGRMPEAETAAEDFAAAFAAFGHGGTTPEECDPEGLVLLGERMLREIADGFAMRRDLEPPRGSRIDRDGSDNGLGNWLPYVACLTTQMGFPMRDALALPVGQMFALIAAHRCNEGWTVCGETYGQEDAR